MADFFTSDQHFDHKNVIKYAQRPFRSLEDMHEQLIQRWNDVIRPGDNVYVVGDFCFRNPDRRLARLHGNLHLVRGNHDNAQVRKHPRWRWVKDYHEMSCEGQKLILCHYPLLTWRNGHHGSWMLHGHCHGTLGAETTTRTDVGVDVSAYTPLSFNQIKARMASRHYQVVDHHGAPFPEGAHETT